MTDEDDAFIRTIVDNPGQDVPRLVYADWLDDRDDPRGPFLRAEVEWAQPWKDGKRPRDATELRAMAAALDPLWVARVARPPVGVCCDHITFDSSGPRVDQQATDQFESIYELPLPDEYKAFLLNSNGGAPRFRLKDRGASNWDDWWLPLQVPQVAHRPQSHLEPESLSYLFYPRLGVREDGDYELWGLESGDQEWRGDAIQIADDGGLHYWVLYLAVRGKYAGRLHAHDITGEWCRFGWFGGSYPPPTLPQLLSHLGVQSPAFIDVYPSQPLQDFWKT